MNQQPDINDVYEAVLITTALNSYAADLRAKYGTEDNNIKLLLQYVNTVYTKYWIIAKTPVVRDALGNLHVKQDQQRSRLEIN